VGNRRTAASNVHQRGAVENTGWVVKVRDSNDLPAVLRQEACQQEFWARFCDKTAKFFHRDVSSSA
jgi:hypothetical protein